MTPIINPRPSVAVPARPAQSNRTRSHFQKGCALFLGALLLPFSSAMATTYYVDSVAGNETFNGQTPATAWKTITATSKVNNTVFQPGDQVLFKRGGNWAGTIIPNGYGGTSGSPVVFDSYGTPTDPAPHIQGANGAAFRLWNKRHFTIQNFDITNNPANTPFARNGIHLIYQAAGTYGGIKILNNVIHDIVGYTTRGSSLENYTNAGIYVEFQGAECLVDDVRIEGNDIFNVKCIGIFIKPGSFMNGSRDKWMTNLVIRDNVMNDTGGDHIVVQGASSPLIEYNAGYDAGILAVPNANLWIAGMWVGYMTRNSVFQFNEVARTITQYVGGNGDSMAFDVDYGTVENHTFQYNYTHDNEGGAVLMMPPAPIPNTDPVQYYPPAEKTVIYRYNISVNDNRNNASGRQVVMHTDAGVNSAHLYNNVFYNNRPLGIKVSDSDAEYYTNNVFYSTLGHYGSRSRFTNNSYFGHNPLVNDPYPVLADPKFVGPLPGTGVIADAYTSTTPENWANLQTVNNVFKLQASSPLINKGKTIADNGGRDFWNNPLYSGAADIGVHEVVGGAGTAPTPITLLDNVASATMTYGGVWNHVINSFVFENATVSTSDAIGAWAQCAFNGTNVSYGAMRGPGSGRVSISIDNGPGTVVDLYWPIALTRQDVFQATGLPAGNHTIKVTVMEKNPISTWRGVHVDCFKVLPGNPPANPVVTIADNTTGTYVGTWTSTSTSDKGYLKTLHTSSTVGDSATFTFTGTGVRLYGPKDKGRGNLNVTVNGVTKLVNAYTPGKYDEVATRLYEVNGLPFGTYTLQAVVATKETASTSNSVSIDLIETLVDPTVDNPPSSFVVYTTAPGKTAWTHSADATYYNNTKSVSDQIGNYVTFTFNGTGASLYAKKDSGLGKLNVQIDGGAVTSVDCYSPTPLLQQKVFEVSGLPAGSHSLKATIALKNPSSASNFIGLDYFKYQP